MNNERTIGFEVDGYFESNLKPIKWKNFRDALVVVDWAFFGRTQDLATGNLYLCGEFYHEKSTFVLTKEAIYLLEQEMKVRFIGKIENIPLKSNQEEVFS